MLVTVRLFGSIRELLGAKEWELSLPDATTVGELRALVARDHPAFCEMGERLRTAVNQELVSEETALREGDEVAFLPPVAGGQDGSAPGRFTLSGEALDASEVAARVAGPDAGGLVTFIGAVRESSRGREIRHLEYEAYPGMVEREMEKIAHEASARWPGSRVAMAHRTGHLEIGDLAVVIAAAAPHRAEAFAAAQYAIDSLKERVPIWKKEVATDGEYWVEDHA